jgi:hypothetical protein
VCLVHRVLDRGRIKLPEAEGLKMVSIETCCNAYRFRSQDVPKRLVRRIVITRLVPGSVNNDSFPPLPTICVLDKEVVLLILKSCSGPGRQNLPEDRDWQPGSFLRWIRLRSPDEPLNTHDHRMLDNAGRGFFGIARRL